jgi:hypothetical protein
VLKVNSIACAMLAEASTHAGYSELKCLANIKANALYDRSLFDLGYFGVGIHCAILGVQSPIECHSLNLELLYLQKNQWMKPIIWCDNVLGMSFSLFFAIKSTTSSEISPVF